MKNKDNGSAMKVTVYSKDFLNNLSATRRSVIKGVSIDKKQLTQPETLDHIVNYFKAKNERYLELTQMEYVKNA